MPETQPDGQDTKDTKYVPQQTHDEVVQDLLKQKAKAKELAEKLSAFEKEKEDLGMKSLKEKQEWQKVAEAKEAEAAALKKKLDDEKRVTTNYFKRSELRQQALKAGIRENALDDLDLLPLEDITVETTSTGKINVLGADKSVERLKATRPHWFQDRTDPGVDGGTPTVTKASAVSMKDILKLQKEGKQSEYEAALRSYQKQKMK